MKKILFNIFIFSIILNCRAYAKTYDLSQIARCKLVSEYSVSTKVDQMDTITFGSYPQSDVSGNIKDPLEWIVLDKQGDKALLLSKYILDFKWYNDEFENITWGSCTLRDWLNVTFYNTAFNSSEKGRIDITYVKNNKNKEYGTGGGNNTYDHIFLLSLDEAEKYFSPENRNFCSRLATKGTNYAKKVDNSGSDLSVNTSNNDEWFGNSEFWLRTSGHTEYSAATVSHRGSIDEIGTVVNGKRFNAITCYYGVRPAMWVKLS